MFTVYIPFKNADMDDVAFDKESDAIAYINKQKGVMGRSPESGNWGRFGDWKVTPITVVTSQQELTDLRNGEIKRAALAKLTPIEKRLLGLDKV